MSRYEVLHYPGDRTAAIYAGQIIGHDEIGRPYAVLDADYQHGHTTVHLTYATTEQISAAVAERQGEAEDNTERYLRLRAAGLVR